MKFKISEAAQWQNVIDEILPKLHHPLLLLKGNLGAGKTTFTKILLQNLGSHDDVSSPTYAIVNEYFLPDGKVFHFDLYRLKTVDEVYDIGIEEYLESGELCIIEWPEIFEDNLAEFPHHTLQIDVENDERIINFN